MAKQYHIPRTINKIEVKVWQVSETKTRKIKICCQYISFKENLDFFVAFPKFQISGFVDTLFTQDMLWIYRFSQFFQLSWQQKSALVSLQNRQWKSKLWGALIGLGNTDDEDKEGMVQLRYPFARAIYVEYSDRGAVFAGFSIFWWKIILPCTNHHPKILYWNQ